MAAKTPEGKVKDQIKAVLKRLDIWYHMPNMSGMGSNGIPDFDLCINGLKVTIEAKRDAKHKPTEKQTAQMMKIRRAGGVTLLVHADNINQLEPFLTVLKENRNLSQLNAFVTSTLPLCSLVYREDWHGGK